MMALSLAASAACYAATALSASMGMGMLYLSRYWAHLHAEGHHGCSATAPSSTAMECGPGGSIDSMYRKPQVPRQGHGRHHMLSAPLPGHHMLSASLPEHVFRLRQRGAWVRCRLRWHGLPTPLHALLTPTARPSHPAPSNGLERCQLQPYIKLLHSPPPPAPQAPHSPPARHARCPHHGKRVLLARGPRRCARLRGCGLRHRFCSGPLPGGPPGAW